MKSLTSLIWFALSATLLFAVSACTTAKVVSSSGGGPTIQQA